LISKKGEFSLNLLNNTIEYLENYVFRGNYSCGGVYFFDFGRPDFGIAKKTKNIKGRL
jgi:hypothetical protein